ncbi:MAG: methyltransferase domain-containing protein [Planctomycetes bacterium]|nr:methyltransferase domain-containing protein [Planctomycetota bacterium]
MRLLNPKHHLEQLPPEEYCRLRGRSEALCRKLMDLLHPKAGDVLLDVGCGPGELTSLIASSTGVTVIGVDSDEGRIAHAVQHDSTVRWINADATALPFEPATFEAVVMTLAIQRMNGKRAIGEIHRVLRPGGRFALASPTPEQLQRRLDLAFFPRAIRFEMARFPSDARIRTLLRDAGFGSITQEVFVESTGVADSQWLEWIKQRPYSSLRGLSPEVFRAGIRELEEYLNRLPSEPVLRNELVVFIGCKTAA